MARSGIVDDKWLADSYEALMEDGQANIVVTLDTKGPIEIGDFVSAFTSIANQYQKFVRERYPDMSGDARIFVSEVSSGSVIANLVPVLSAFGLSAYSAALLMQADAVTDFVLKYGEKIKAYFLAGGHSDSATDSDLKDLIGSVAAIAKDQNGTSRIESVIYYNKNRQVSAAVQFDTKQARVAIENIEAHKLLMRATDHKPHERVLMTFVQSNIKNPPKDKSGGEKVIIESISKLELPLIYASDLAEERIKHEIREASENVYKKGFVVDVLIETRNDKPVAYKVTNVHQILDLE